MLSENKQGIYAKKMSLFMKLIFEQVQITPLFI